MIAPSAETRESLVAALQAALGRNGDPPAANHLLGATGAASATVVATADDPGEWLQAGRDLWLPQASALFGMQVRELHPVEAAAGVMTAPEFQQHFIDSYLPLIGRALEHGQVVLARGGWPAPAARDWGLIVRRDDNGKPRGIVPRIGSDVPLEHAASQCYVIEAINSVRPTPAEIASCALHAAKRYSTPPFPHDLVAGASAWRRWRERIEGASVSELPRFAPFAQELSGLRNTAAEFARELAQEPSLSETWRGLTESAAEASRALGHLHDALARPDADRASALERFDIARAADERLQAALAAGEPQSAASAKV